MAVDIPQIVNILEAHGLLRPVNQMADWYRCYCPIHNNGRERKPSFGISLRDQYKGGIMYAAGFAHCFACGYSRPLEQFITDVLDAHNIKMTGQEWLIANVPGYDPEADFDYLIPESMMDSLNSKYAVDYIQKLTQPKPEYISEEELASYRYVVPYMYERKLTDEVIEKYDVGYDAKWIPPGRSKPVPCITFPVRDAFGNTLFLCRRSIQGKLYNYPQGVTKPVYGIDMIPPGTKSLVICESCINTLTSVVYGKPAVGLLGTGNAYQMKQLKQLGVDNLVICTDGDDAGRRSAQKIKKQLQSVAFVWIMPMPDGKDLNDLTKDEFDQLYAQRE